jgi:hypothetical protein
MSDSRHPTEKVAPADPMPNRRPDPAPSIHPAARREIVAFLREWLPPAAIATYREMILADPESWHRSPHFASGFVIEHFFRGNGITEKALGVDTLEPHWADILREAVVGANTDYG